MRSLNKINNLRFTFNVFSQNYRNFHLCKNIKIFFYNFPETYNSPVFIRHFNSNSLLSRDRSNNTNTACSQSQGNIILQCNNFAQLNTWSWQNFKHCYDRTFSDFNYVRINFKFAQSIF